MLDNLELITRIDKSKMLDVVADFPNHIVQATKLAEDIEIAEKDINNIVISGMGGSAISGDILKEWLRDRLDIPIFVNRDYNLPKWVGKDTLSIFLSYSGNTEETLSSFREAIKRKSICVGISSGGKLEDICKEKSVPHVKIPSGFQPRAAIAYLLFPTIKIIQKIGLLDDVDGEIKEAVKISQEISDNNKKEIKQSNNLAKSIALSIKDTLPHIYGWRYYVPIARRWRTQINENSKMIARFDEVPECNHNDIVGWTEQTEIAAMSSCVFLRDKADEPERISERYEFMREVFENAGTKVIEINAKGKDLLAKMISLMYLGDFISCYLAILKGVDPTPVDVISKLKGRLSNL